MNIQGSGLGLSICKRIIEQMGGSVNLHNEINEGSIFTIIVCPTLMLKK